MSIELIKVPFLNVNDSACIVTAINVENGALVEKGEVICTVETTKSAIDIESEFAGYIYVGAELEAELSVNDVVAVVSDKNISKEDYERIVKEYNTAPDGKIKVTKKAEIIAQKNSLNLNILEEYAASFNIDKVDEKLVYEYLENHTDDDYTRGFCTQERVAIIGGVSGGGALIVIDSILKNNAQTAVAIFDQDEKYHGKEVLGVPIVGSIEVLESYYNNKKFDSVVIAFNRNLEEREKVYNELTSSGYVMANIIDPSVNMRSNVKVGKGNVILGNTYIGACSIIGDNNFISSNVCLEHGNVLGSHCAFGPGVTTSGNVHIRSRVRFATGIFIEPSITIGEGSIISSGAIVRETVKENTVIRVKYNQENVSNG